MEFIGNFQKWNWRFSNMEFDISKNRIGFFSKIKFFEKIKDKVTILYILKKKNEIKSQNSSACKYFSLKINKTF